jgi:hypothetical protein
MHGVAHDLQHVLRSATRRRARRSAPGAKCSWAARRPRLLASARAKYNTSWDSPGLTRLSLLSFPPLPPSPPRGRKKKRRAKVLRSRGLRSPFFCLCKILQFLFFRSIGTGRLRCGASHAVTESSSGQRITLAARPHTAHLLAHRHPTRHCGISPELHLPPLSLSSSIISPGGNSKGSLIRGCNSKVPMIPCSATFFCMRSWFLVSSLMKLLHFPSFFVVVQATTDRH